MAKSCESECKKLHESRERPGQLAQILVRKSSIEKREIREKYMAMYGEDLSNLLQKSTRSEAGVLSSVGGALWVWMLEPIEFDAVVAREALDQQGSETNYRTLVEMFVGRKSSHVFMIKQAYLKRFGRQLDQDIGFIEPPHQFKKILEALVASHKAHHADVSQHIAKCDAMRLYQTGEGRPGAIDEAVVLEILSKRSIPQLKLTFFSYKHIYGHDYTKSLKNRNCGEFEEALKVVVKCIYNPPKYYAQILYGSIKGLTKDKGDLARVLMSRSEVDMDAIQRAFKKKYGMEVREAMCESESESESESNVPSGDYRDFLVALATKTHTIASAFS